MIFTTSNGAQLEVAPEEMVDFLSKIEKQQPTSKANLCMQDMHTKHIYNTLLSQINWSLGYNTATSDILKKLVDELY